MLNQLGTRCRELMSQTDAPVKTYDALNNNAELAGDISIHGALIHVTSGLETGAVKGLIAKILKEQSINFTQPEEVEPTMDDVFVKLVKKYEAKAS